MTDDTEGFPREAAPRPGQKLNGWAPKSIEKAIEETRTPTQLDADMHELEEE